MMEKYDIKVLFLKFGNYSNGLVSHCVENILKDPAETVRVLKVINGI
jgi:hypothetical protein